MSAPLRHDAALRFTEAGQSALHYLGSRLKNPTPNPVQQVHAWDSADYTTRRVVAIGATAVQDLSGQIVWDGSPDSLTRLLASGRRGATLDYIPSLANPSLSFPCVLVDSGEVGPDPDFWHDRRFTADVRLRRLDGGSWQALLEEPLFYYRAGSQVLGLVFTRSGTVAPYTDSDGLLKGLAANLWRTDWLWRDGSYVGAPDTPALLLEPARINLVSSDNFDAGWTSSGTPVITASISDPAGGTAAYRIADDDAGSVEYKELVVAFTGDGVKTVVFTVREATMPAGGHSLTLYDDTAAANRLRLLITAWASGVPTVSASTGTYLGKRYVGNGYWAIYGQSTSVTAANSNRAQIVPAVTSAETGSIDVYPVNAYNAASPAWSVLDASETKALDTWYATFPHAPQVMTGFADFVWGMTPNFAGEQIVFVGNAGGTGASFRLFADSGSDSFGVYHDNGVANVNATVDISPSWGDRIQARFVLNANGSVLIGARKDSGAGFGSETVSTASGALALASAWADTRLYLSHPTAPIVGAYIAVKLEPGVKTMADMVAL